MKRNTVLAAVMTGALATAIVPMAQAQDVPLPAVTHDINGAEYFLTQDGTHYVPDRAYRRPRCRNRSPCSSRNRSDDPCRAARSDRRPPGRPIHRRRC